MRRREFIGLGVGAAATWPLLAHAQQTPSARRVGVFLYLKEQDSEGVAYVAAFEKQLRALGWIPGGNLQLDYRWTGSPVAEPQTREAEAAARALGVKLTVLSAAAESDFDQVFTDLAQQRADALFVSADPFFFSKRERLVALAAQHAIPTIYELREFAEAGGLMSYGTVISDGYYKGGNYIGQILKGTKPADLPVEQVNKFEMIINQKTAKTLSLTVPPSLLALADEVIE